MVEEIAGIGYINDERKHVMMSIRDPSLCNLPRGHNSFVQVVITIDNAILLRAMLNKFLTEHGLLEH